MAKFDYDLLTIGAGSGGVRASRMSAEFGARVAVCENSRVGGTCVIRGCIPKKLLVYGAHFADEFADSAGYGWTIPTAEFDWGRLVEAKNREIDRLNGVYIRILRENGVEIIEEHARLVDPHTIEAGGRTLTAETILIAVGARPGVPDIPGREYVITSDEAFDLESLPKRVVIVGGGYIGVEFAGIFNGVGAEVTEIVRADTILRGFDQDVRLALADGMAKRGITIRSECVVRGIEKVNGALSLRLAHGEVLDTDLVMYATGRAPRTEGLGLEAAGVGVNESGSVAVDKYSRTSVPSVFAIGDVTDRVMLTPVAIAEGAAFAETVFNDNPRAMHYGDIPTAVFSQPPLASVGLTEDEARARHTEIDVYMSRYRPLKHTLSGRDESTVVKLVVHARSDRVVGCHMLDMDAPEIIQGLAIAMTCGATKAQFDATIGIHPSAAEEFVTLREKRPQHPARAVR
ncbi:MAG: glutathione-disulfide reductase [Rhodospirillales bacterium]|jgi:glutathione reductase (NADPH)|nr:glutathione-disulfide reductase [Rhodospirillales bacterium]